MLYQKTHLYIETVSYLSLKQLLNSNHLLSYISMPFDLRTTHAWKRLHLVNDTSALDFTIYTYYMDNWIRTEIVCESKIDLKVKYNS